MRGLSKTELQGIKLFKRGKVRDVYDLGDSYLFVASDRVSVYDVVLPTPIAGKGAILTQMSNFWFEKSRGIVENHLLVTRWEDMPTQVTAFSELKGRCVIVKKTKVVPIECVVRGYITGSGWSDYKKTGAVCGIKLPPGLEESEKLPEPLFTPATKAEAGHDENISFDRACEIAGRPQIEALRELSIRIYTMAEAYARERGVIIADTKFEFGVLDGKMILIDEVLTPDSSRFWPAEDYAPGRGQKSFDKQFVRDYAASTGWDKTPPGPELPDEIVAQTRAKYELAFERITGRKFVE